LVAPIGNFARVQRQRDLPAPTWGLLNEALHDAVTERVDALHAADPENKQLIPVDLVTACGSGLDPHISLAAAQYQAGARCQGAWVDGG
jgi:K+-transporting ATPase c subunit